MQNDEHHEFAESAASIPAFLAQRCMDEGYPTRFADAICQCGCRVFSLAVDETNGEACWFCDGCDAVYLFHSVETDEEYHGSPDSDEVDCVCPCGQAKFEIVVGVTGYGQTVSARTAYIGCRCVACGLMGCYASWPRVDMPYARFFSNLANRLESDPARVTHSPCHRPPRSSARSDTDATFSSSTGSGNAATASAF